MRRLQRTHFQILMFLVLAPQLHAKVKDHLCERRLFESSSHLVSRAYCQENGLLQRFENWFSDRHRLSSLWVFDDREKLVTFESFNLEGERVQNIHYRHLEGDLYEVESPSLGPRLSKVLSQLRIQLFPRYKEILVQKTYFREGRKVLREEYDGDLITRLQTFGASGKPEQRFEVTTEKGQRSTLLIREFKTYDSEGRLVGQFEQNAQVIDIPQGQDLKPVVIMDSGIDYLHPQLRTKMARVSGLGIFPDTMSMGWYFDPFSGKDSPQILDQIYYNLGRYPYVPFSHGTHVAALTIDGVSKFGLVGFAGDYSEPEFLDRISDWLKVSGTRFVNMSFGFGDQENPFGAGSASRTALIRLMSQNPQVLFVVAAGNDKSDLDSDKKDDVPPKAPVDNKIVVAALNTDRIERNQMEQYRLSDFSNFGTRTVDIAAAGDEVLSANIGGGSLRLSGTSMAAPQVLNAALKVSEVNPALTAIELKELLMCTGYHPKSHDLPLVSGRILDLEEALRAARESLRGTPVSEICRARKKTIR